MTPAASDPPSSDPPISDPTGPSGPSEGTAPSSRSLLILGGTSWLGGAVARSAVERGHEVTCLARGMSGKPPDGVRFVEADRWDAGAYAGVSDQHWDSVLDVSWQPELVRGALAELAERTNHWVYVSSCSVYADDSVAGRDESDAVHEPWPGSGSADAEAYGPAKVACERACLEALGDERVLLARPGLIVGYGDRSDRFGYWPARVALAVEEQRPLLVPTRSLPVQVIEVADLAAWLVHTVEERIAGTYNVVGDTVSFGEMLQACADAVGGTPSYVEVDGDWLLAQEVEPWMGESSLPLWVPPNGYAGFMDRSNSAAVSAGLTLRPIGEIVRDSLRWERNLGLKRERHAGLTLEREHELVERAAKV